jgi:nucleotide-binding universal stress UspA family protein
MERTNVYKRILVPVDGSSAANLGLREALQLARQHGASVCLFYAVDESFVTSAGVAVMSPDELSKAFRDAGREILAKAEALARRRGVRARAVLGEPGTGPVADAIIREAKRCKADLIVMGTHGRRGVRRLVMGSDAEQVLRETPVPVLMVRGATPTARRKAGR